MNRAERRAAKRAGVVCALIPWPKLRPLPIRGLALASGQAAYTCAAHPGWCTITTPLQVADAFAQHTGGG